MWPFNKDKKQEDDKKDNRPKKKTEKLEETKTYYRNTYGVQYVSGKTEQITLCLIGNLDFDNQKSIDVYTDENVDESKLTISTTYHGSPYTYLNLNLTSKNEILNLVNVEKINCLESSCFKVSAEGVVHKERNGNDYDFVDVVTNDVQIEEVEE